MTTINDPKPQIDEILAKVRKAGFTEGYAAGWKAAIAQFEASASTVSSQIHSRNSILKQNWTIYGHPPPPQKKTRGRPAKAAGSVLDFIRATPGKTGAEIAEALPKIPERTVRTSLRRLKIKGFLYQEEGKWFVVSGPE